jgi:N-methylhydantoinase A
MEALCRELEREGSAWLDAQGLTYTKRHFRRSADMRYDGQSFEITVDLDGVSLDSDAPLIAAFEKEYEKVYGYANSGARIEVRDLRLVAVGQTPKPRLERRKVPTTTKSIDAVARRKKIFHDGTWQEATFIDRGDLAPGMIVPGPSIIRQYDTTTFVPAGFSASSDEYGNLLAEAHP